MRRRRAAAGVALLLALATLGGCGLLGDDNPPPRENGPGATLDAPVHRVIGTELLRGDWETGNMRQWDGAQAVSDDRIQVVTSPVDQGRFAGRFEVRDGDDPIGYGDRAEVQVDSGETEGADRWYAWSTMFDPTYPTSDAWQVVTQWHCADCDGTPSVGFYVIGDRIALQTNPHDAAGNPIGKEVVRWSAPLDRGRWHHFRLHAIWSGSDSKGLLELWHDGEKVAGPIHTRTLYPGHDAYFKQGLYRQAGVPEPGIVYHDAFRMSEVPAPQ
jgi:hypothetical protein